MGESIAIVGLACRFPKAPSPAAYWRLLRTGTDAVTDAPPDRRADNPLYDPESAPPGTVPYRGGFLDRVDTFDADFFGISPREAAAMDPQQRLMLELAWEVVEDARTAPATLRGSRTGVFVGTLADDYAALVHQQDPAAITRHTMTGLHRGFIANRVSYTLGLHGPSLTVDTGQSSSLTAVHLACESLRRGECTLAVAGGVHLNLAAPATLQTLRLGVLSPAGVCATFDGRADGYVRGEGGGAVLLKPLSRALADGDRVYCVIRGSAVNNDGATAGGLTAPGEHTQRAVLRAAYRQAGLTPSAVQYVESHGTGTRAGDPVEAAALAAVCATDRPGDEPLLIGSAKTNIGHLEGAAGIAGLIKTALSIAYREIPPNLHFHHPNPDIPLADLRLEIPTAVHPWPPGPALAGVSSFGLGGSNCHLVLTDPPPPEPGAPVPEADRRAVPSPWVLSGRTEEAVRAQAARLLEHAEADLGDIGFSLATTRNVFEQRAAVVAADRAGLLAGLQVLAEGGRAANVLRGTGSAGPVAFLFAGQGFQRVAMGQRLYDRFPAFAEAFDAVCAELDRQLDRPLRDVIWPEEDLGLLDQTRYTQPALFAIEVALHRLMESFGLRPDFVAGHSVGEFAAAHAAGVLDLADAARLVAARGRLMQALPPGGAMIAVQASLDEVAPLLAGKEHQVTVAAVNGPAAVVISGDEEVAGQIAAQIAGRGRKTRRLRVSHAFHSPLMEPAHAELRAVAESLTFHAPSGPRFVSTVLGRPAEPADPDYWVEHARRPVRFADAVAALHAEGAVLGLELGPGNGLTTMGKTATVGQGMSFLASLHGKDEALALSTTVAALHVRGFTLDWRAHFGPAAQRVDLPTYPFQRRRHWLRPHPRTATTPSATAVSATEGSDAVGSAAAAHAGPAEAELRRGDVGDDGARAGAGRDGALAGGAVRGLVMGSVREVLGYEAGEEVDGGRTFKDLGFDSGMTVELATRLGAALGRELQPSLIYSCPTPVALVEHLERASEDEPADPVAVAGLDEPIAIIGMGCRYPGGVTGPEELWELVREGRDAISEFPADRGWDLGELYDPEPGRPGRSYVRHGGFLHDAGEFDAAFFGISPREATAMDPQQRVLLETCWEALERAGLPPDGLRGEQVGVYVGATAQDYGPRLHESGDGFEGHRLTGGTPSVLSGRIAYVLGLRGPAVTVDTACSSSLVALHLAGQALRQGDCRIALAGGVTVMASPGMFVEFSMQRGLAPDGRCKPFAAGADGTAWAEGVGVVVLERLSDARRLGHPILAVVRGSATNQDGASNGLSAPNGDSQERVIRQALAGAGLAAGDIDAVEAHGTGTALGDPIEATALIATYGKGRRPDRPLLLGSLKSNIGHTQAAAGIGGVIKMVLAMRDGVLPRSLHLDAPSPHVDWATGQVRLLTEAMPWPDVSRPRRSAVSSFGISGTNAHVVLEQAPGIEPPTRIQPELPVPWVLSASSTQALRAKAADLTTDSAPVDVAYSLGTTRAQLRHRAAVVATDPEDFRTGLAALVNGEPAANLVEGTAVDGTTVFVFPGQGSQWPGMALDLLASSAVFRDRMADCEQALTPFTGWSLRAVLRDEDGAPPLGRVDVVQPVLFSIMVSLAAAWQAAGVTPDAVAGHSQGEIAAACVAGALSLSDAAKVVALRSRALGELAGTGGMASVPLPADEVRRRTLKDVEVAAINGVSSTTVAGPPDAVHGFVTALQKEGIRAREVDVDYASHSSHVEPLRATLAAALDGITPRTSDIPFVSTVTGEVMDTAGLDADYWFRNLRSTVRFEAATRTLLNAGHRRFIEVSPHPLLSLPITETAEDAGTPAAVVGTLRRDHGDLEQFVTALARAYTTGARLNWDAVAPGGRRVPLPTYPFQHERFWLTPPRAGTTAGIEPAEHPLLGAMTELPDGGLLFTGRLSLQRHRWLTDHRVAGTVFVSATTLLDLAVHAGLQVNCPEVEELTLQAPLVVPDNGAVQLRITIDQPGRTLTIHSRAEDGGTWIRHATGTLGTKPNDQPHTPWPTDLTPVDLDGVYEALAERGYGYGPGFQGLKAAWRHGDEVFAEVEVPDAGRFALHPVLLDSALHALLHMWGSADVLLPFTWTSVTVHTTGAPRLRVRLSPDGPDTVAMTATTEDGEPVATVGGLAFRPMAQDALVGPGSALLRLEWADAGPLKGHVRPRCAVVGPGARTLPGPHFADLDALGTAIDDGLEPPDLVFAACTGEPADDVPAAIHANALRALKLVQAWLADDRFGTARLVLIADSQVEGAPVWGLVRSAQSENPGRFVLADVDPADVEALRTLPTAATAGEPALRLRGADVLVPRLHRRLVHDVLRPPAGAWKLETGGAGTLEDLALLPAPEATTPLDQGQVRIAVRAGGLNFRDVTVALGLLPNEKSIGIEGAGIVTATGPGVTWPAPGDRVMGLFDGAFGPTATADHQALAPIPEGWSFAEAASVPVAYITAYQCLVDQAGLRKGQTVVVHAATGGVGCAAVQLAQHLGAEVFATAGPDKWHLLRAMGLDDDHIASSRSTAFAARFRAVLRGKPADVVLNALAGELTDASLGLLGEGGRFVEMGKTDIRDPERVAQAYPGVSYLLYNLRDVPAADAGRTLARVLELFGQGALRHAPLTAYDVRRGREAFTLMSRARHVGKIVITVPAPLDPAGTVLITGGTGTLGGLLARHLVTKHGVRRLILTSRRGTHTDRTAELADLGAHVDVVACDVADRAALRQVITAIPADHPLTAVIHAAGTIDDVTVSALTPERLAAVLRPKADGAWHLHELTEHLDLAAFILFSSVIGVFGEPGQANYAAANSVLDVLARHRHARGLPASSLAWGVWAERSAMTSHMGERDLARLRRSGIAPLPTPDALRLFDAALGAAEPVLAPLRLDESGLAANDDVPPLLRGLIAPGPARTPAAETDDAGLAEIPAAERHERLLRLVCSAAAAVLGQAEETLAPDSLFRELGVDSLTGLELRNRLSSSTGLRLRASVTTDNPTPSALAGFLAGELAAQGSTTP